MLEWNGELPRPVNTLVHHLILAQAVQHPKSQAVCSCDYSLTYSELDNLSSRLAKYLISQGVGVEVIVPLCFEKSVWAIVSVLAVLKAGGAFLLLDSSQPISRLESITSQAGSSFALSSRASFDTCQALVSNVFVVDATTLSKLDGILSCESTKPNNAAYYIFTSGSTGSPKGVISM